MLKSFERMCKCGCGQIINLNTDRHIIVNNVSRNSYYYNNHYLLKIEKDLNKIYSSKGYKVRATKEIVEEVYKYNKEHNLIKVVEHIEE